MTDTARAGLVGWVRVVEVTQGKNGWHVHVHALLVWREGIRHEDSGGLDVGMATLKPGTDGAGLHEYFVKLAHEITGGQAKLARGGGRTPFQLLSDAVNGLADEVDLWHERERASKGRRQMEWSRGRRDLRKWAGLGQEQTDEEIAEEELTGDDLVLLMPESWRALRDEPPRVCALLEAAEGGGFPAAIELLDAWGLRWLPGKAAPPYPPPPPDDGRREAERAAVMQSIATRLKRRHQVKLWRAGETFDYQRLGR